MTRYTHREHLHHMYSKGARTRTFAECACLLYRKVEKTGHRPAADYTFDQMCSKTMRGESTFCAFALEALSASGMRDDEVEATLMFIFTM